MSVALLLMIAAAAQEPLVDRFIAQKWADAAVTPAAPADDAEFLRRATLDLLGTLPAPDEVRAFLADPRPDKRALKIDEMLARPAYAAHWAQVWENILLGNEGLRTLHAWLRDECFARNMPYDRMARALTAAKGDDAGNGAAGFVIRHLREGGGAVSVASKAARVFLGTQIQCAQCHDHPFDRITQDDFHGMVAFFARARIRKVDAMSTMDTRQELYDAPVGETQVGEGKEKRTVPPRFLGTLDPNPNLDRRAEFARLLARPENPQFARAVVNRYWAHFFGRGIVQPVDDFSDRNRPSHPELLEALARDFVEHGCDLKRLIRAIAGSKAYGLSSRKPPASPPSVLFSYAATRPLTPAQMHNSVVAALGLRTLRAAFPESEGTVPQALLLMNGAVLNQGIAEKSNRIERILRELKTPEERVEMLFLSVLSRPPTGRERAAYARMGDRREAYEDLAWALLNSSEFLFNH